MTKEALIGEHNLKPLLLGFGLSHSCNNKDIILILGYNYNLQPRMSMISLLLHEAKLRMSVNNKDIIQMYLGYNWLITQKALPINAFFVISKQWLQVMFTYQASLSLTIYSFDFFSGDIYLLSKD